MRKKIIHSTFILFIGGFLTKLLSMIIKIYMTRFIGVQGISLYMLVLPTFSFAMNLAQAGFPLSLSRIVATKKRDIFSYYFTAFLFLSIFHILFLLVFIQLIPFLSRHLLHQEDSFLPLLSVAFVIPFTTVSAILRSYFIGKEKMGPPVISNILENVVRFALLIFLFPHFLNFSTPYLVFGIILSNIISEGVASLFLFLHLPKRLSFSRKNLFFLSLKEIFSISLPTLFGNIVGNITYFLEPILFMSILLSFGFGKGYIQQEYGVLSGYVFPLLFLPSFFTNALSQAFLPYMSRKYEENDFISLEKVLIFQILLIFFFSIGAFLFFFFFGKWSLSFLYNTSYGVSYLKILSPFCFFYYIQPTIHTLLLAMAKGRDIFFVTVFGSIVRILSLITLLYLQKSVIALLFSFLFNIVLSSIYEFWKIKSYFS